MRYVNETIMSAVTINADVQSAALDTSSMIQVSAQAVVTGTVAGTLKMQASNDPGTPTSWSDISGATIAISNAGTYFIPKQDICYMAVRLAYVSTSGTGALTAKVKANGY